MVTLFIVLMFAASIFVLRLGRKTGLRRDPFKRRPGRSDGVRTVYKRHS
ncbi:MAG: hypothetical protein ACJ735_15205 [Actinomycetes bacterium]